MSVGSKTKNYSNIIQNCLTINLFISDFRYLNLNFYFLYLIYKSLYSIRYCFCNFFLIKHLMQIVLKNNLFHFILLKYINSLRHNYFI